MTKFLQIVGVLAKEMNLEVIPRIVRHGEGNRDTLIDSLGQYPYPYQEMLNNGTIDMMAIPFQKTYDREQEFDFSYPLYEVKS